jgi:hypothetical protein
MKQYQRNIVIKTLKEWCVSKQMPIVKITINDARKRPSRILNYKIEDGFLIKA